MIGQLITVSRAQLQFVFMGTIAQSAPEQVLVRDPAGRKIELVRFKHIQH